MAGLFVLVALSLVVVALAMGVVGSAGGGWRRRAGFTGCPSDRGGHLAEPGHLLGQAGGGELNAALPGGDVRNLRGSGAPGGHQRLAGLDVIPHDVKALRRIQQAWKAIYAPGRAPARYA